jgi:hypothetical protein
VLGNRVLPGLLGGFEFLAQALALAVFCCEGIRCLVTAVGEQAGKLVPVLLFLAAERRSFFFRGETVLPAAVMRSYLPRAESSPRR